MTPAEATEALLGLSRCRGCGGWRWHYADRRPCTTCVVLSKRREIQRVLGGVA